VFYYLCETLITHLRTLQTQGNCLQFPSHGYYLRQIILVYKPDIYTVNCHPWVCLLIGTIVWCWLYLLHGWELCILWLQDPWRVCHDHPVPHYVVLPMTGVQLLEVVSPSHLQCQLDELSQPAVPESSSWTHPITPEVVCLILHPETYRIPKGCSRMSLHQLRYKWLQLFLLMRIA